jgi:hypothetical protein
MNQSTTNTVFSQSYAQAALEQAPAWLSEGTDR